MWYVETNFPSPSEYVTRSAVVTHSTQAWHMLLMFHSVHPSCVAFSEQTVSAVCRSVFIQRDYGVALCCLKDDPAARGMLCRRLSGATLSCITSLIVFFTCFTCISLSLSECNSVATHAFTIWGVRLHRTPHLWPPMQCIGSSQTLLTFINLFSHLTLFDSLWSLPSENSSPCAVTLWRTIHLLLHVGCRAQKKLGAALRE